MRRITKLGSVLVGIGAGAAAVVWLIKDRLLGPETGPVSVDDAPAFRVAPPSSPARPSADADDLSEVKGIGPVYRARLEQAGVTTFAGLAAMTFMTATASATNYCDEPKVEQVYARSDYTKDTHIHLDVACPHGYEAIACGFDMYGKDDKGPNKFFVAVNDATPFKFDSKHNGHKLDGDYGCHFRVNNFKPYFPGHHDRSLVFPGVSP